MARMAAGRYRVTTQNVKQKKCPCVSFQDGGSLSQYCPPRSGVGCWDFSVTVLEVLGLMRQLCVRPLVFSSDLGSGGACTSEETKNFQVRCSQGFKLSTPGVTCLLCWVTPHPAADGWWAAIYWSLDGLSPSSQHTPVCLVTQPPESWREPPGFPPQPASGSHSQSPFL
jgi:hypothetical protein